jgi:hypothetical protein
MDLPTHHPLVLQLTVCMSMDACRLVVRGKRG